jgi:hypothetical protein
MVMRVERKPDNAGCGTLPVRSFFTCAHRGQLWFPTSSPPSSAPFYPALSWYPHLPALQHLRAHSRISVLYPLPASCCGMRRSSCSHGSRAISTRGRPNAENREPSSRDGVISHRTTRKQGESLFQRPRRMLLGPRASSRASTSAPVAPRPSRSRRIALGCRIALYPRRVSAPA